ncbi:MAG: hypothetical protein CUN55_18130, partial [Phototrophicales bacterium]
MTNRNNTFLDNFLKTTLLEYLPDFVIVYDHNNAILYWNQKAKETFGYT